MSISFACDFCTRRYKVDDALAGKRVKCKECGTEIAIPAASRALAAARSAAPPRDLYGLDDEDDSEAPLPPPRRPGMAPDKPRSRSRGGDAPEYADLLRRSGFGLLIVGSGAFILPFFGLQWRLIHLMAPVAQYGIGLLFILGGVFCLLASSLGVLKALAFSILGGVVGIPVLSILLALVLPAISAVLNRNNQGGQANGPNVRPPMPNFNPPPNPFAPAAAPAIDNKPPGGQDLGRVTITGGRAMPGGMLGGVAFEVDYRVDSQGFGVFQYDLYIKSSRGMTKIMPPVHLNGSGKVNITVPRMRQEHGPFEAHFEVSTMGKSGSVSNSVNLPWADAPPQPPANPPPGFQPPGFQPNRGFRPPTPPRMPRFGRR